MKFCGLLMLFLTISSVASAQLDSSVLKRPLPGGMASRPRQSVTSKGQRTGMPFQEAVTDSLNLILKRYAALPDIPSTWAQVRQAMDTYLFGLWMAGRLAGLKPQEAYYVKMGPETMTVTDISQHRKIAVVGIAQVKPAEFTEIRVQQ